MANICILIEMVSDVKSAVRYSNPFRSAAIQMPSNYTLCFLADLETSWLEIYKK